MSFSDWITIVSILIAVLFAIFKFDEREIIRLKQIWKFAWPSVTLLGLSGLSAYFHSNGHPRLLDVFWQQEGIDSGLWPLIWLVLCVWVTLHFWNRFVHQAPTDKLIELYSDMLKFIEPASFSMLFRKYERYFLENVNDDRWLQYQEIFKIQKWWYVAPVHFRQILKDHPSRLFDMDRDVLKTFLRVQFANVDTPMMEELENEPREGNLDEQPLIKIFLGTREAIRRGRDRNILIPTIKEISFKYFNSNDFIERDRKIMNLKPSDDSIMGAIPEKLMPFYFINFIHWYWVRAILTKPAIAGFYQYQFWTELILENAPELGDEALLTGGHPNYYCLAVNKILSNIGDWIQMLDHKEISDMQWASDHFILLKLHILKKISDKYPNKVRNDWFIAELTSFMFDLLSCRKMYGNNFNPTRWLSDYKLPKADIETAFVDMTDREFVTPEEQSSEIYKWITTIVAEY
ncbi:MAG TPA: hypothetical protein PK185_16155 [Cyclobacteriaceae bacterium]|nr:hypothetical protein [Cyclobacteriaceae bacterium]